MLIVETYFRVNDSFINAERFDGHIPDTYYVEGSLSINVNGRQIIDRDAWDYIDQLWAYIVDGICSISSGKSYECYFPDQPIKISFEVMNSNSVKLAIDCNGEKSAIIETTEFITRFSEAAARFFKKMKEKIPEDSGTWDIYLEQLASMRKQ